MKDRVDMTPRWGRSQMWGVSVGELIGDSSISVFNTTHGGQKMRSSNL